MEVEVVGIIALGIQVCGEVKSYIDGCKAAPEELASIAEQLATWQTLLMTIRELTENDKAHNRQVNQHVQQSMRSVEKRIKAVQKAVRKLGPSSRRSEVQELEAGEDAVVMKVSKKQRLLYGMRREKIKALMANVNELNTSLALSLHLYHIEFNSRKAQDVDAALYKIFTILSNLPKATETPSETDVDPDTSKDCAPVSMNSEDTLCEEPQAKGTELAITSSYTDCTCSARRKTERLNKSWGWFSVTTNRIEEIQHEPGCVWTDLPPAKSAQATTVSIRTGAYWRYFATAITASYDRNISILPVVQTFNLRDLSQSPVVQLIDLADLELGDLEWDDPLAEEQARRYWHKRLMELFHNGKASPRDVDCESNRTILHFLPFPSQHKMRPYTQLTWQTLNKLNFSKNMMLCDGLAPWEYNFSKSVPLASDKLEPDLLPWNADRWLEPDHIPEAVLTGNIDADGKCARAFVLAKVMHTRTSLLETSNVSKLCQAIILRSADKALELLEDGVSQWSEHFLGDDSDVCAIDLAIMWFPELIKSLMQPSAELDKRLKQLRPPRPHPSNYSFLEVAINIGLRHGSREGEAPRQAYIDMIQLALEDDHPIYFQRVSKYLAEVENIVTAHLADRRGRLAELVRRRLPLLRLDRPDLVKAQLVDEKIEELLGVLQDAKIPIPEALYPRRPHNNTRLASSIFEYAWHSESLCNRLTSLGFDPEGFIRSRCCDGPFPMAPLLSPLTWDTWRLRWLAALVSSSQSGIAETTICNVAEQKHSPSHVGKGPHATKDTALEPKQHISQATFIHALFAFVAYAIPDRLYVTLRPIEDLLPDPEIAEVIGSTILSEGEDGCFCGCSLGGCTPLIVFTKVIIDGKQCPRDNLTWFVQKIRYSILTLRVILRIEAFPIALVMQLLRLYTFSCLRIRHTCCIMPMRDYIYGRVDKWPQCDSDEEELHEIHQEDQEKMNTLEDLLFRLEGMYKDGTWDLMEFVEKMWYPLVRDTIHEEDQRRLSEQEIERIQNVGVQWNQTQLIDQNNWDDEDDDSIVSIDFGRFETDDERLRAVTRLIDQICF
ncbi:hypothetical protein LIA77_09130 [Sarocladium implicatum]|nr:hypothetical protein LIA77_09130 [Sarocladium implicatum]